MGTSRKSFIGALTGDAPVADRFEGSLATTVWAMTQGAAMVRVHDVRAAVQAARLLDDGETAPGGAGAPALGEEAGRRGPAGARTTA